MGENEEKVNLVFQVLTGLIYLGVVQGTILRLNPSKVLSHNLVKFMVIRKVLGLRLTTDSSSCFKPPDNN